MNDKTKGLIGEKELAWTKAGAMIVNMGRGGIDEEDVLAHADEQAPMCRMWSLLNRWKRTIPLHM